MGPDDSIFSLNDTLKTIKARRSVRTFTGEEVTDEQVKVLLHAANLAPSAHNQHAWRFIVLRGSKKSELAQLVTAQSATIPKPAAALLRMGAKSIISAPVVIAVANTGDLIRHGTDLFKVEKKGGVLIVEGLAAGDRVIASGAAYVRDGETVRIAGAGA